MSQDRYTQARNITLIGAFLNVAQGVLKLLGGYYFHSHALIADGIHSFSDLLTDILVIFASHYGNQDADAAHPYGHQRIETTATLLLSLLLILVGTGICWAAFTSISENQHDTPTYLALVIACGAVLINEVSFWITLYVGKKINSSLIQTNAWHRRADSASSLVVACGILGSLYGYTYLDSVAAIVVALFIIKVGVHYSWHSVQELIDTGVAPETLNHIQHLIISTPGVNCVHQLRTRSMGGHILVDVHILVFQYISVSEGHYIAQNVHHNLIHALPSIRDVTVHVDPENDDQFTLTHTLPPRQWIEKNWLLPLQHDYPEIQTWTLHYLAEHLIIDLYLKIVTHTLQNLQDSCKKLCQDEPQIKTIRLFHSIHS